MIGHSLTALRQPLRFLASLYPYGDLVELRFGPHRAFLPLHPDLVRHVLHHHREFDKGGALFEFGRTSGRIELLTCEWQDHQRLRPMMQPFFRKRYIAEYGKIMSEEIARTDRNWQTQPTFDISACMTLLTSRTVARALFGADLDEKLLTETDRVLRSLFTDSAKAMVRGGFLYLALPRQVAQRLPFPGKRSWQLVNDRFDALVGAISADCLDSGRQDTGILSLLLSARDEAMSAPVQYTEVRDNMITALAAGSETTATVLAWTFYTLARQPHVEQRLHAEVDEVLGGRAATFEDLPRLTYTTRVITEVLRMYPPAWIMTRTATEPTTLGGRHIPQGSTILLSPYAQHHNPVIFPRPELFDPDRWLPERAKSRAPGSYIPFAAGNRKCLGDTFAMTEATLAIATLAGRWRLRPRTDEPHHPVPHTILGTGPLLMTATLRDDGPGGSGV